ncbi:MAG: SH3 domain-containing protein, partial [Bacillales bacterium]
MKKGAKVLIPVCFAVLSTPAFAKAVQAADNDSSPPVQDVALTAYQQQYVDVDPGSYLNVRQSPSTHAPVIARLMRGTEV